MKYDYIIIGGGIGGLYVAYNILKKSPGSRILVLEKENTFGGRVFTYTDSQMSVEAGAGRFNTNHLLFIGLLKELGLYRNISKNSNSVGHYYIDFSAGSAGSASIFMDSILDYHSTFGFRNKSIELLENIGLELWLYKSKGILPNAGLIARIIIAAKLTPKKRLMSMKFLDFAKTVINKQELDFLVGSFGYYSELVLMNAYDCCNLMMELDPSNQFYSLKGGLSLFTGKYVKDIQYDESHTEYIVSGVGNRGGKFSFTSKSVVCALPKHVMEKFAIFRPILPMIRGILSAPLCRIYAKYPIEYDAVKKERRVWFKGMPKFTVNNELRMVIPISEKDGVIMISYSDNKFAEFWNSVYKKRGEKGLNKELCRLFLQATGMVIPDAIEIRCFFWEHGVGYWGKGADSESITENIIQPFENKSIYICGENFSNKYQQWMEGALDTGSRVIQKIFSD
jgi:hypothetical protein